MTDYAATTPAQPAQVKLDPNAVLSQAWRLYKRLFLRSVLMGAVVFGTVNLLQALTAKGHSPLFLGLFGIFLTVAGIALLQGGLVEIVRGLHADGDADVSMLEVFRRAGGKTLKLVRVSALAGLGIALASLLLVVPGVILAVRWAVAVPVAILEEGSARSALGRSRALLKGNGWAVFKILFVCGVLNALMLFPLTFVTIGMGPFAQWLSGTAASALATPYLAHALTIVYYSLLEPQRPVTLEPGQRWSSVWDAQDAQTEEPAQPPTGQRGESVEDEYQRRFDEREKQWGG
jgi:hypothetical protein